MQRRQAVRHQILSTGASESLTAAEWSDRTSARRQLAVVRWVREGRNRLTLLPVQAGPGTRRGASRERAVRTRLMPPAIARTFDGMCACPKQLILRVCRAKLWLYCAQPVLASQALC